MSRRHDAANTRGAGGFFMTVIVLLRHHSADQPGNRNGVGVTATLAIRNIRIYAEGFW